MTASPTTTAAARILRRPAPAVSRTSGNKNVASVQVRRVLSGAAMATVRAVVVRVMVAEAALVPSRVMELGDSAQVEPCGAPLHRNVTGPAYPAGAIVRTKRADEPALMVAFGGASAREKSAGGRTLTCALAVWLDDCKVAVTVCWHVVG